MKYKIISLGIEGFRAFAKPVKINFASQLTVIYGENGTGKTSIYDAISWLFNNDLIKYVHYGDEWNRVKLLHTRSLFSPDVPSKVTATFQSLSDTVQLIRGESRLEVHNKLAGWFSDKKTKDKLVLHLLGQHDLYKLSKAKGRERLETLAPLLDITKEQENIDLITLEIKKLKIKENDITMEMKANSNNAKENSIYFDNLYYKVNFVYSQIKDLELKDIAPPLDESKYTYDLAEIKIWNIWVINLKRTLIRKSSDLKEKLNDIIRKYSISESLNIENNAKLIDEYTFLRLYDEKRKKYEVDKISFHRYENDLLILKNDIEEVSNILLNISNMNGQISQIQNMYQIDFQDLQKYVSKDINYFYNINILNAELIEYENINKHIVYYANNINEYNQREAQINETIKIIESNLSIDNYNNKIQELNKKLQDESNIKNIYDYNNIVLARNELMEFIKETPLCPLCGQTYNNIEELLNAIRRNTIVLEKMFKNISKEIKDLSEEVAVLKNKEKEKQNARTRLVECRKELANIEQDINMIENDFHKEIIANNILNDDIKSTLVNLLVRRNWDEMRYHINEYLSSVSTKIEILTQEFRKIENIKSRLNDEEKELKLLNTTVECRSKAIKNVLDKYQIDIIIDEKDYQNIINTMDYKRFNYEQLLESGRQIYINSTQQLEEYDKKWLEYLNSKIDKCKILIEEVNNIVLNIESIENILTIYNRENELNAQLEEIKIKIKSLKEKRMEERNNQKVSIDNAISALGSRIGLLFEIMVEQSTWKTVTPTVYIPNGRERTNLIFNPVPGEQSSILSLDLFKKANSAFILSSGLLSVLGLSIFFAQASEKNNTKICDGPDVSSLFIDDPIQVLDSVRDEALACLLCDISLERQIIVSTSDINFANRLILTSRPMWERIPEACNIVYIDRSNNEPEIKCYQPREWIDKQRIYIPKIKKNPKEMEMSQGK